MSNRIPDLESLNKMIARGGSKIVGNPLSEKGRSQPQVKAAKTSRARTVVESAATRTQKRGKYGNVKTVVGDIEFDSTKEAARYGNLLLLLKVGLIRDLELQVEFELMRTPIKMSFVADFCYYEKRRRCPSRGANGHDAYWQYICEDVKGHRTREYLRKRKAMKIVHGITIRES